MHADDEDVSLRQDQKAMTELWSPQADISHPLLPEEREIAQGLAQFDPQLAGLYIAGCKFGQDLSQPGGSFLLAHIGRELSRGLVSGLKGDDLTIPFIGDADAADGNARGKRGIADAFQLPIEHPRVTEWHRCVSVFSRSCHFRSPGPDKAELALAFTNFIRMVRGRVGPFFLSYKELKKLMDAPVPSEADIEKLKSLLLHPQQRRTFFSELQHPGWIESLIRSGFLGNPPGPRQAEDGELHPAPWF